MTRAFSPPRTNGAESPAWLTERLAEARAVIADVAHHSDHLIRIACDVLVRHGESEEERREARVLLLVIDARTPQRHGYHQRHEDGDPNDPDADETGEVRS